MPAGKSPGHDRMTREFFLSFWMDLKGMVVAAVHDAWDLGSLGEYFNRGLVCLCPKTGDLWLIAQWRPITLLPLFYKLIAKALSMQIRPYMDSWVEEEQRGFVSGRTVADNLLLFREAKWHTYASDQEVTFLQLDYSKAYDQLEWLRPKFCRWVEILCADATAVIIVNSDLSCALRLLRYVRQGCPLAPCLF